MGKYGEAMGIWNLKIGGADLKLRPKKGDNLRLMELFKKNKNNEDAFFKDVYSFMVDIIKRDVPPANEQETEELETYVEFNLMQLFEEMMIAFKWATKESLAKLKEQNQKKVD